MDIFKQYWQMFECRVVNDDLSFGYCSLDGDRFYNRHVCFYRELTLFLN